jgi:2-keto-4-pentenoate hydratase/2-oxohepta-3-ene-1,7-dioic acid hydratase in catechol pathway
VKLITFTHKDRTRIGIIEEDRVYMASWGDEMLSIIRRGVTPARTSEHFPLEEITYHAPIKPGKIIGVGRNYADHAAEMGNDAPKTPLLFAKLHTSVIGTGDTITWNEAITSEVDWEGELAVIIGRRARNVADADAYRHIHSYTVANDISARDLQKSDNQWVRAKGLDTFCPLGPVLITRDEIADPHALTIKTTVNGEEVQNASTGEMIFKVPQLIAFCSAAFTLEPGDVILTGTPAGVGSGMKPPRYLKDGDEVSITIDGIGTLTNTCKVTGD